MVGTTDEEFVKGMAKGGDEVLGGILGGGEKGDGLGGEGKKE